MSFRVGQPVTPNVNDSWVNMDRGPEYGKTCPFALKFGEVYHVGPDREEMDGEWWVNLEERPSHIGYMERYLSPVITDKELSTALEEISEPQTA